MFVLGNEASLKLRRSGAESEASGGGLVFGVVRGGVEDLGLSPAEGDGALTSSTGLF